MSGSKTSYPHNVSFTCRSGFILVGSSQRTCLRNGTWSGEEPTCLGIVKSKEKSDINLRLTARQSVLADST